MDITGGAGVRFVFDPVGGPMVQTLAEVTAPYGTIVLYGVLDFAAEPQNFACLNKEELGLISVRCEIWRGFIFINLDNDAMRLADYRAPLSSEVSDYPLEAMTVKAIVRNELDCNRKTAYDNFLESYHITRCIERRSRRSSTPRPGRRNASRSAAAAS